MTEDQLGRVLEVFETNYPGHKYTLEFDVDLPPGKFGYTDFKNAVVEVKIATRPTVDLERETLIHELAHVVCGFAEDHGAQFDAIEERLGLLCAARDMKELFDKQELQ